jgi:hypothetical protein
LKQLLNTVNHEEELGDFDEEQEERKRSIEEAADISYDDGERLFLRLDDILKVYMYIHNIMSNDYQDTGKRKKKYSELMGKVKYALVARRPELLSGE